MNCEAYNIARHLNMNDIDTQLAMQCAPFIMGLKISNLFIIENEYLWDTVKRLECMGISYFILLRTDERTTFLLYNEDALKEYLSDSGIQLLLKEYGYEYEYEYENLNELLIQFRIRYRKYDSLHKGFPHEIGIFLGYPIEDVLGFIHNKGDNALYTGYWKVYANLPEKLGIFHKFETAEANLFKMLLQGHRLLYPEMNMLTSF